MTGITLGGYTAENQTLTETEKKYTDVRQDQSEKQDHPPSYYNITDIFMHELSTNFNN